MQHIQALAGVTAAGQPLMGPALRDGSNMRGAKSGSRVHGAAATGAGKANAAQMNDSKLKKLS